MKHPSDFLEGLEAAGKLTPFLADKAEPEYVSLWLEWLGVLFDAELSEARVDAYAIALRRHGLTNAELGIAGDWIERSAERFPTVSAFLGCPDLGRNSATGRTSAGRA